MKYLVFDTETTGLVKHPSAKDEVQPKIIEFGGALVDETGKVLKSLCTFINPQQPIPAEITKITGITDEMVADAPTFAECADDIRVMFKKADAVVAHNLPFDAKMMLLELNRAGITDWPWPKLKLCTVQEHVAEWGRRPKLTELYKHYMGVPLAQTHRALDDVLALVEVCIKAEMFE